MSKRSRQSLTARRLEACFAEFDFPGVIQPRLVIEYPDGLKIIVDSRDGLVFAAGVISELRYREPESGPRLINLTNASLKIHPAFKPAEMRKSFDPDKLGSLTASPRSPPSTSANLLSLSRLRLHQQTARPS